MRLSPALFLTLAACDGGPAERPLTVQEVVENAHDLDGRVIVLSGWLQHSQPLSCGIFASAEEVEKDFPYYLSIASSRRFDRSAEGAAPRPIVLRARLWNRCISNPATELIAACGDRAGTLQPLNLVRQPRRTINR